MKTNFQQFIFLYATFIIVGIGGNFISSRGTVINSVDIIVREIGWIIAIIATAFSIIILHKVFSFKEIQELPMWIKVIIHLISVTFISMFLVGIIVMVNASSNKKINLSIKIVDAYKRLPKRDYKYSYSYTRYYLRFINLANRKTYLVQISEGLYEDALLQKTKIENTPNIVAGLDKQTLAFMKEHQIPLPKQQEAVQLKITKGALGFWR